MSRLAAAAGELSRLGHDALLVSSRSNIRYLSGFNGTSGYLVVRSDGSAVVVTDARYEERIADELRNVSGLEVSIAPSGWDSLPALVGDAASVALEASDLSWSHAQTISNLLGADRVSPTSGLVEGLREHKDEEELSHIRSACAVADQAFSAVIDNLKPGRSERDVAWAFAEAVRAGGGEGVAYPPIVASGPNASRPHHATGDRPLAEGDLVIVDAGAMVEGYRSDMTRSFVLGQPTTLSLIHI